jgi:hypothetical protein
MGKLATTSANPNTTTDGLISFVSSNTLMYSLLFSQTGDYISDMVDTMVSPRLHRTSYRAQAHICHLKVVHQVYLRMNYLLHWNQIFSLNPIFIRVLVHWQAFHLLSLSRRAWLPHIPIIINHPSSMTIPRE